MGFAIAGAVAAIISAAVSAYAYYESAQTAQAVGKYNKKVAQNAAQAQRQAAAIAAENERDKARLVMGQQRANIGGSGVLASEGTPLLVQIESAEKAKLNEARIRYSGEVGARQYESEGIIAAYQGQRGARQGYIHAGASVLTGVGEGFKTYGLLKKKTGFVGAQQ